MLMIRICIIYKINDLININILMFWKSSCILCLHLKWSSNSYHHIQEDVSQLQGAHFEKLCTAELFYSKREKYINDLNKNFKKNEVFL